MATQLRKVIPPVVLLALLLGFIFLLGPATQEERRPIFDRSLPMYNAFTKHRYIGRHLPDDVVAKLNSRQVDREQYNITANALLSDETSPNYGPNPNSTTNRCAFVSNGVAAEDGSIAPDLVDTNTNLWIMRPDGTGQQQITTAPANETDPAWDPANHRLAYISDVAGTRQVFTVDLENPQIITQITQDAGNKSHPTWSPDQNWIVYVSDINGNLDLFKIPANGAGLPQQLTTSPNDDDNPEYNPRYDIILYDSGPSDGPHRIYQIPADASSAPELMTDGGGDATASDIQPSWRKNGNNFAFASNRLIGLGDSIRDFDIYVTGRYGETGAGDPARAQPGINYSNLDPLDESNDTEPCWESEPLVPRTDPRNPFGPPLDDVRLFYTSDRLDPNQTPADTDRDKNIWSVFINDTRPPFLVDLPWSAVPGDHLTEEQDGVVTVLRPELPTKLFTPGSDIAIHVKVRDVDTGVNRVTATFKDPDSAIDDSQGVDHKIFDRWYEWVDGGQSQFTIELFVERDCEAVGSIQLFDDGDLVNNDDLIAGDGVYSGIWTSRTSPSDFYVDIDVRDEAGNFKTFDDVYGFTTEIFQPHTKVLLVMDYVAGQAFLAEQDWNYQEFYTASMPYESYYTTNPSGQEIYNTFLNSVDRYPANDFWRNIYPYSYDLYRTQCRGPISMDLLGYYLPTVEYQPTPPEGGTVPEPVLVADRIVLWAAPHTGDIWTDRGTLTDAATQSTLAQFLDRGGRLVLSGSDIGFALTLDGFQTNTFLSNYVHAEYIDDDVDFFPNPWSTGPTLLNGGISMPLVSQDPWQALPGDRVFSLHWGPPNTDGGCTYDPPVDLNTPIQYRSNQPTFGDAQRYTRSEDEFEPIGGAQVLIEYDEDESYPGAPSGNHAAGLFYADPNLGYQIAFFPCDLAQINRRYHTESCPSAIDHCRNHRAKLIHNCFCAMRTGTIAGQVLSATAGYLPIRDPNPTVKSYNADFVTLENTGLAEDDGSYVINGVPSRTHWVRAQRPGYRIDHLETVIVHGGGINYKDFVLTEAPDGAISGTVTSQATGAPIANVHMTATDSDTHTLLREATTGSDGTYTIASVPVGDWDVTADGSALKFSTETRTAVRVNSGTTTENVDFQLTAAPGTLVAKVVSAATGQDVAGATILIRLAAAVVGQGSTGPDGVARVDVQPGVYEVIARAPGFAQSEPQGATILSLDETNVQFALQLEPPGSMSGLVVRQTDGRPLGGVVIQVWDGATLLSGVTAVTSSEATYEGGYAYNYKIDTVPTGTYTVIPVMAAFSSTPPSREVTIVSGVETQNVSFAMSTLHTFPAGLSLVSTPFDYSTRDPADLLALPSSEVRMASWVPLSGQYAFYPAAPADHFRLGQGYWLLLASAADLAEIGRRGESPYEIPLKAGWNMIGTPFPDVVDYYGITVRRSDGVEMSLQNALSTGVLQNGLFTYGIGGYRLSTELVPFTGYWQNALQNCTLVVEEPVGGLAAREAARRLAEAKAGRRPLVATPPGGWVCPLVVKCGNLTDQALYFGAGATNGYDAQYDVAKPPFVDFAPSVYGAFAHPEWGKMAAGSAFAADVRAKVESKTTWDLTVKTSAVGEQTVVSWPDLSALPRDLRATWVDLETGKRLQMRTTASYSYRANAAERHFRIEVAPREGGALVVRAQAVPTRAGVQVVYTLSRPAHVDMEVVNISGRRVRALLEDEPEAAGRNELVWDARGQGGARVPNGQYLIRVRARADDGAQHSALVSVTVIR